MVSTVRHSGKTQKYIASCSSRKRIHGGCSTETSSVFIPELLSGFVPPPCSMAEEGFGKESSSEKAAQGPVPQMGALFSDTWTTSCSHPPAELFDWKGWVIQYNSACVVPLLISIQGWTTCWLNCVVGINRPWDQSSYKSSRSEWKFSGMISGIFTSPEFIF